MENDFVGLLNFAIGIDEFSSSIQQVFWILEFSSSFCFVYMVIISVESTQFPPTHDFPGRGYETAEHENQSIASL